MVHQKVWGGLHIHQFILLIAKMVFLLIFNCLLQFGYLSKHSLSISYHLQHLYSFGQHQMSLPICITASVQLFDTSGPVKDESNCFHCDHIVSQRHNTDRDQPLKQTDLTFRLMTVARGAETSMCVSGGVKCLQRNKSGSNRKRK